MIIISEKRQDRRIRCHMFKNNAHNKESVKEIKRRGRKGTEGERDRKKLKGCTFKITGDRMWSHVFHFCFDKCSHFS